ncbi:MAG: peptidoglycan editing factor PgeF [Leptolyngbya sp. SIO4C1]|nr:peptidoglycan editing factor PgeF [Leptolyngbya sp. SIO4C1]
MHRWTWQAWQDKPYLTCDLLADWAHGFFTQQFAPAPPEQLVDALAAAAAVYRTQQVHGNVVLSPTEIEASLKQPFAENPAAERPSADGSHSDDSDQAVWVCTADCTPALIGDVRTGQVAAVHAGWRGTAQKIVPIAIARLQALGSQLKDLRVALGPAIAGEVYQVNTDVAAEVGESILDAHQFDSPQALVNALMALDQSPVLPDAEPDKVRLDVRRINALQLEQLGLAPEQVAIAPHCTYQNPDKFFSYRRTGQRQVQWSGIVSR